MGDVLRLSGAVQVVQLASHDEAKDGLVGREPGAHDVCHKIFSVLKRGDYSLAPLTERLAGLLLVLEVRVIRVVAPHIDVEDLPAFHVARVVHVILRPHFVEDPHETLVLLSVAKIGWTVIPRRLAEGVVRVGAVLGDGLGLHRGSELYHCRLLHRFPLLGSLLLAGEDRLRGLLMAAVRRNAFTHLNSIIYST